MARSGFVPTLSLSSSTGFDAENTAFHSPVVQEVQTSPSGATAESNIVRPPSGLGLEHVDSRLAFASYCGQLDGRLAKSRSSLFPVAWPPESERSSLLKMLTWPLLTPVLAFLPCKAKTSCTSSLDLYGSCSAPMLRGLSDITEINL